jgi:capsular exopolysaccharide synthesis family protein
MVGVPLAVAGTTYVIRQPAVYQAVAVLSIIPPQADPEFSNLVSRNTNRRDTVATERYYADKVAGLSAKDLALRVVTDPAFVQNAAVPDDDAAEDLLMNLRTLPLRNSNLVKVFLDGIDPALITKQLAILIGHFVDDAEKQAEQKKKDNKDNLRDTLVVLQGALKRIDNEIATMLNQADYIGPGGKNFFQTQYENASALRLHKTMRLDEAEKQAWYEKMFPKYDVDPEEATRRVRINALEEQRHKLTTKLEDIRRVARRSFDSDPAAVRASRLLQGVLDELDNLRQVERKPLGNPSEMIVDSLRKDVQTIQETSDSLLNKLKASIPEYQRYQSLQDQRELMLTRISDLERNVSEYELLSRTLEPPVKVMNPPTEPIKPSKAQKPLKIALVLFFSFGLGVGLVCLLEHLDHTVKVPEHLSIGLLLPLLGVIPRIRRTALVHKGGHLWTAGDPNSVEADAYRNLRASLLGASDRLGPIVTLLVTSAKAGEGKSTTALNLAATCARAGERTLLMDVDLRRPSLAEVFHDGESPELGLVDVLRGEVPWQRTLVGTEVPNLDFLPTGDARGIPIEILATLELRQLMIALAGHYDRVILDGPAVLGLPDCRMLGRVVDAALMVVRSHTHEMRPLQRAKAMLEQSHVVIVGVTFNGLYDDLENWSSYGPDAPYALSGYERSAHASLGATGRDAAALPLAGSVQA